MQSGERERSGAEDRGATTTSEPHEASRCVLCRGGVQPRLQFDTRALVYCARCELGQLDPLPTDAELSALYASDAYFQGNDRVGYADYALDEPQFRRTFARIVRRLLRGGPIDALLEIGCGPGLFLAEARRAGIRTAVGVDLNPWAVEQVRRQGFAGVVGTIDAVAPEATFDAIVMLDLLEHVTRPQAFLESVRAHLRPGGRLFVMTPNLRSVLARVSGARWVSFKIPEHVVYYTPRSLRQLCRQSGFEDPSISPAGQFVTLAFVMDRLKRLVPTTAGWLDTTVRRIGWEQRAVFVTNGSMYATARRAPG